MTYAAKFIADSSPSAVIKQCKCDNDERKGGKATMARIFIGSLLPNTSLRAWTATTTVFNPEGDWGNAYQLAYPGDTSRQELVCDAHGRVRRPNPDAPGAFRWEYQVTITNIGFAVTSVYVDW